MNSSINVIKPVLVVAMARQCRHCLVFKKEWEKELRSKIIQSETVNLIEIESESINEILNPDIYPDDLISRWIQWYPTVMMFTGESWKSAQPRSNGSTSNHLKLIGYIFGGSISDNEIAVPMGTFPSAQNVMAWINETIPKLSTFNNKSSNNDSDFGTKFNFSNSDFGTKSMRDESESKRFEFIQNAESGPPKFFQNSSKSINIFENSFGKTPQNGNLGRNESDVEKIFPHSKSNQNDPELEKSLFFPNSNFKNHESNTLTGPAKIMSMLTAGANQQTEVISINLTTRTRRR